MKAEADGALWIGGGAAVKRQARSLVSLGSRALRFRGFQRRVKHFYFPLLVKALEPFVEENIYLLLKQNLLNPRRYFFECRNMLSGSILRDQCFSIVDFNLFRSDANALTEPHLDKAENFKPEAHVALYAILGQSVSVQERLPTCVRGTFHVDACGQFLAYLKQPGGDLIRRGFGGLRVLLADLLLDERTADQLFQRAPPREHSKPGLAGIENRQPHLLIQIAGKNSLVVYHSNHPVKHHDWRRLSQARRGEAQGCCPKPDWPDEGAER